VNDMTDADAHMHIGHSASLGFCSPRPYPHTLALSTRMVYSRCIIFASLVALSSAVVIDQENLPNTGLDTSKYAGSASSHALSLTGMEAGPQVCSHPWKTCGASTTSKSRQRT
jgi:hypothetical protein